MLSGRVPQTTFLPFGIHKNLPSSREQSSLPLLKRVQAGIRLQRGGTPSRMRLPITLHTLGRIGDALSPTGWCSGWLLALHFLASSDWGNSYLSQLGYSTQLQALFGRCNPGQPCSPTDGTNPRKSKCDQFGGGSDVVLGLTGTVHSPIVAMVH